MEIRKRRAELGKLHLQKTKLQKALNEIEERMEKDKKYKQYEEITIFYIKQKNEIFKQIKDIEKKERDINNKR